MKKYMKPEIELVVFATEAITQGVGSQTDEDSI